MRKIYALYICDCVWLWSLYWSSYVSVSLRGRLWNRTTHIEHFFDNARASHYSKPSPNFDFPSHNSAIIQFQPIRFFRGKRKKNDIIKQIIKRTIYIKSWQNRQIRLTNKNLKLARDGLVQAYLLANRTLKFVCTGIYYLESDTYIITKYFSWYFVR